MRTETDVTAPSPQRSSGMTELWRAVTEMTESLAAVEAAADAYVASRNATGERSSNGGK